MAVIGTFGSFTAARLGIYASQSSLNVTGNNIANINTKGYTRQRLDLVSLHSAGNSRYANGYNLDIGYGVLGDSVSQLRDPYLDIRYRDEQSSVGAFEARLKGLQQLSSILDEVGQGKGKFGIIEAQFNDFLQQLQQLNKRPNDETYDTTVRSSAESLVDLFHSYSEALTKVKDNQLKDLQGDVKTVNTILTKIRDLNVQIRDSGIYKDKALELRDQRNVLIDELSKYMKIDVRYSMEKMDDFSEIEKLTITLADSGTPPIELINGIYGTQLTMPVETLARNPEYDKNDPRGMKYLDEDGKPTDIERLARRNDDGTLVLNDINNNPDPNTVYDPDFVGGMKYLDANGDPTDDPALAATVDNAKEKSDENRLWMQLQPLTDKKGRYMKDIHDRDIKEVVDLGDNDLYGTLQSKRELLTEEGEFASSDDLKFDPNANIKRGIPYYQRALDALARKFADSFNEANTDPEDPNDPDNKNRVPVFVGYETKKGTDGIERYDMDTACDLYTGNGTDARAITQAIMKEKGLTEDKAKDYLMRVDISDLSPELQNQLKTLQEKHLGEKGHGTEKYGGGILFSNKGDGNDPSNITAANISISNNWSTGAVRILNTKKFTAQDHSTANDNIYHMIGLMSEQMEYKPEDIADIVGPTASDGKAYFKGSFQQRLADINNILATDQETTAIEYNSFESKSLNLENQRQSVSGVDLNDEATNMMMYQKSYAAACQLMTTLDSMLDKLINGTLR